MINIFYKFFILLAFLSFWQIIVIFINPPVYLFPSPSKILLEFINNWPTILENSGITLFEALIGFLVANLISISTAIVICFHKKIENMIMSLAIILKTMPVIALVPILIIWFGSGIVSKIIIVVLICFFPTLVNVIRGIKSIDNNFFNLFSIYSVNNLHLVKFLIFPSILPYIFSALKVSSSLAVIGALVGEFIGSNQGLGFLIMSNYYNMNTALVFAAVIVSSIIGISAYYIIQYLEDKIIKSQNKLFINI